MYTLVVVVIVEVLNATYTLVALVLNGMYTLVVVGVLNVNIYS